jgi:hypothetical protein
LEFWFFHKQKGAAWGDVGGVRAFSLVLFFPALFLAGGVETRSFEKLS